MSELRLVQLNEILSVMPQVAPLLEPAIERSQGRWDLYSVIGHLMLGQMHLWISIKDGEIDAACCTRIVDYPKIRVLSLPFLGGKVWRNWMHFQEQLGAWGRAHGCKEMEGYARKGFARVLTDWEFSWTFIRKAI